ncbi:hypothetical protein PENTCL1PPCAC_21176 [Pristionchus entomophagus]|uniref:Uncharacterized protein n=1 Tax=Pristionchus entomophagus TaxID=358040 RepID=A0AAV5TX11_9BILA|nr:hypothetical protein PENTCL1PPCAC_21176 [Pristionchus entomophagus]
MYMSLPEASNVIAKQIIVHDYIHDDISLYDISKMQCFDKKGYLQIEEGNKNLNIFNLNAGLATAPIAVWIVRGDAPNIGDAQVFEAGSLNTQPAPDGVVTVMSAEPFTLRSETDGLTHDFHIHPHWLRCSKSRRW